jgi:predicted ester cyclase
MLNGHFDRDSLVSARPKNCGRSWFAKRNHGAPYIVSGRNPRMETTPMNHDANDVTIPGPVQGPLPSAVEQEPPLERNKRLSRRILEQAFNEGNLAAIDTGFTGDAVIHDPGIDYHGPAQLRQGLAGLLTAFPDFHFEVLDQLAEGDRVVIRYRGQGTHRGGEFLGIPASGRRIDYTGLVLVRLAGEQIAEFWAQPDQLGLLKQLGARMITDDPEAGAASGTLSAGRES